MKKNFKKRKNQSINSTYSGYVLYDANLNEKYFVESLNEIIAINDVFDVKLSGKQLEWEHTNYDFDRIYALDQVSFVNDPTLLTEKKLKKPAAFKLIYFNNNLRGFYYSFNRILFDESSIKKFILSLEKQYFKGKYKQTGSSYKKWIEQNQIGNKKFNVSGNKTANHKLITMDENLTKRIRAYVKQEDLTLVQFFAGVIATYYKTSKNQDIRFKTNVLDEDISILGNLYLNKSYGLKKSPKQSIKEYLHGDWKEFNKHSDISIVVEDRYHDIKGSHYALKSSQILDDIEFRIVESDWVMEIQISYQKYSFNKDEIFLMLNKIRMAIFQVLENDHTILEDVSLMTRKETEQALRFVEPKVNTNIKSVYDQFLQLKLDRSNDVAIKSGNSSLTYNKLGQMVTKMTKVLKSAAPGDVISIESNDPFMKVAAFLAADHVEAVYNDESTDGFVIKKGLFGYKLKGNVHHVDINGQYVLNDQYITRAGYVNYCNWYKNQFNINKDDRVLSSNLLKDTIPALLSGATVILGDTSLIDAERITFAALGVDELKDYSSLKAAVVNQYTTENVSYNLYLAYEDKHTVPYCVAGKINGRRVEDMSPVDGLGMLVLNKRQMLTEAFENGYAYFYGEAAVMKASGLQISQVEYDNIYKSELRAKWYGDGNLRI